MGKPTIVIVRETVIEWSNRKMELVLVPLRKMKFVEMMEILTLMSVK